MFEAVGGGSSQPIVIIFAPVRFSCSPSAPSQMQTHCSIFLSQWALPSIWSFYLRKNVPDHLGLNSNVPLLSFLKRIYHIKLCQSCDVDETNIFVHMDFTLGFQDAPCKIIVICEDFIPLINIPLTMAGTGSSIIMQGLIINSQFKQLTMDSQDTCSICERRPEDLLVLLCQHNLCVNCATEIYHLNEAANPFICEICLSETPLDAQTIQHFEETRQSEQSSPVAKKESAVQHKPPKPGKKYQQSPPYLAEEQRYHERNYQGPKKPVKQQLKCIAHDEPAVYFCFDCQAADICSECILTAKHANHKVSTLKKAAAFFEKKLEETVREKQSLFEQLINDKSKLTMARRHIVEEAEAHQQELKEIFDNFARTISDQFASNCMAIENEASKVTQIYDGCLAEIDDKLRILKDAIEVQKRIGSDWKAGQSMSYVDKLLGNNILSVYAPRLPKQIPALNITIRCPESIMQQLRSVLDGVVIQSNQRHQFHSINQQQSLNGESIINFQPPRTVLKQSHVGGNKCTVSKMKSSRKLELSRSLDNATNIINKLQERSRKAN